jgi:site-specific recombinase XerD
MSDIDEDQMNQQKEYLGSGAKYRAKVIAGEEGVKARTDYQVSEKLTERLINKSHVTHEVKIARYRDRTMSLLVKSNIAKDIFDLFDRRSAELLDKIPDNSEVALYSDFIKYLEYCQKIEVDALPFKAHGVDAYLSHLMAQGRKRSTIDRHIASIVKWANILELDDPRKSFKVKTRLLEIRKKVSSRTRQAEGLRVTHLERAITEFDPEVPRDCQDITLLFVGFETLCRQSELVSFDWADFELQEDGTGFLHLARSKTDQDSEGEYLYLSVNTCNLVLGWKAVSNPNNKAGAIFRGIYSDASMGDRLSARGVQRCFKRIALRLGLQPAIFSGHSTRVGSAQEMIERNIDSSKVMLSGRWKSMAMLVRYGKKINAKRSGIADLTTQLGWNSNKKPDDNLVKKLDSSELSLVDAQDESD